MSILELRGVHRVHGTGEHATHALRGVSLVVAPGELVAVMGPSGSGKSTLLNLAGGLDASTHGEVHVEGQHLGALSRKKLAQVRRRRVGYVFQDLSTLAAVGASPRLRRVLSLSQSGVIAGLGSLLGAAAGLGAGAAVLFALNQGYANAWPAPTPYPITVPWLSLGVSLLVVPAVAMLGAGLFTRSRLPIERRSG